METKLGDIIIKRQRINDMLTKLEQDEFTPVGGEGSSGPSGEPAKSMPIDEPEYAMCVETKVKEGLTREEAMEQCGQAKKVTIPEVSVAPIQGSKEKPAWLPDSPQDLKDWESTETHVGVKKGKDDQWRQIAGPFDVRQWDIALGLDSGYVEYNAKTQLWQEFEYAQDQSPPESSKDLPVKMTIPVAISESFTEEQKSRLAECIQERKGQIPDATEEEVFQMCYRSITSVEQVGPDSAKDQVIEDKDEYIRVCLAAGHTQEMCEKYWEMYSKTKGTLKFMAGQESTIKPYEHTDTGTYFTSDAERELLLDVLEIPPKGRSLWTTDGLYKELYRRLESPNITGRSIKDEHFAGKAGSGERFADCVKKMTAKGAKDPKALCAYIGRKAGKIP